MGGSYRSVIGSSIHQSQYQIKPIVEKIGSLDQFYDKAAFAGVTQARFGTVGRNTLRGPGAINLDLSLFRDFPITERIKLQFRAEAFNFTNTPHFDDPTNNFNSAAFMRITSAVADQRTFRFGLRTTW